MEILVCIKEGHTPGEMAHLDALALETALVLKSSAPSSCSVHIRAMGLGSGAEPLLRRALGMGVDEVLWLTASHTGLGSLDVARILAAEAGTAHLILTGLQSETGMSGSVGPFMAGLLNYPSLMGMVSLQWEGRGRDLVGEREMEGGIRERFRISTPCVMGIQSGRLTPRYPSLGRMLAARKQSIPRVESPLSPSPRVMGGEKQAPDPVRGGENWQGAVETTAGKLNQWLKERQYL